MKTNDFRTQLDMFKPVQTGLDLRPPEVKNAAPTSTTYLIELTRLEKYCLIILETGEHDSIQIMRLYNQEHDTSIDWHEFSNALDHLHTRHFVDVAGFTRDGQTIYKLL